MSLREQKKLKTRRAISHAATRLFIRRGFEYVTIAEVAEAARVAKMTVTNHFGRKEDLVFDIRNDFVDWPAQLVLGAPSVTPFVAVRDGYFAALEERSALLGFADVGFVRMVRESETLRTALMQMHLDRELSLVAELTELDRRATILPYATGAHLTAVLRLLFDVVWDLTYQGVEPGELVDRVRTAAELAFEQLEPALG
ncbi:MAG TPA: TetR/AcrR family transcriptional regulator [Amycolatopsis sp.]|nr:TetR/AcrR family transcriptional regulator [Amycolatopsis sp.]